MGVRITDSAAPLATGPLFMLIRHHFLLRQQPTMAQMLDHDGSDLLPRLYTAAESSLALLLDYVIDELLNPPDPDQMVPMAERLALGLNRLERLLTSATSTDAITPHLSNQSNRQWVMPAPLASLLVQTTLVIVLSALADDAKWIVVSTPRASQGDVLITVEADAAGLDDGINAPIKERLAERLAEVGGTIVTAASNHQSWIGTISVPGLWKGRACGNTRAAA